MTLNAGDTINIEILAGQVLTVAGGTSAFTGTLTRLAPPGDGTVYPAAAISGSSSAIGPFAQNRNYALACTLDTATYSFATFDPETSLVGSVPAAVASSVVATEKGNRVVKQTLLTIAALAMTMRDTQQGGGKEIYDFPEGRILVLGCTATLCPTTHSAISSTLNSGVTCNLGLGTVTQANATLATTEQDLLPVTAWTSSTTIDVAPASVSAALAAAAQFDGTATAKKMFLNLAVAGATDIDADASMLVTGTVLVTWVHLGDY